MFTQGRYHFRLPCIKHARNHEFQLFSAAPSQSIPPLPIPAKESRYYNYASFNGEELRPVVIESELESGALFTVIFIENWRGGSVQIGHRWRSLSLKYFRNIISHPSPFLSPNTVESLPVTGLSRDLLID